MNFCSLLLTWITQGCTCSSRAKWYQRVSSAGRYTAAAGTYLLLELAPDTVLLVCLDDDMVVIEILDDEVLLLVQGEKDLLDGRIAASVRVNQLQWMQDGAGLTR